MDCSKESQDFAGECLEETAVATVRQRAEKMFVQASGSHDWEHTLRVYHLCDRIGSVEGADMSVVKIAAYLHDIGRCYQDRVKGRVCHAEKGAAQAVEVIGDIDLSEEQKKNICHSILCHRFRNGHVPGTIEAKVLFDADKLDAIGAVGVARAYQFAGEVGARLHNPNNNIANTRSYSEDDTGYREYMIKLRKIKDRIMTAEGRRMAAARHEFMTHFFRRFIEEVAGMC
jgi:uncharacterized protein